MDADQPRWVDSHCHLFAAEESAGILLDRAAARVDWVMCPGIDLETSLESRRISLADPTRVMWAAGLHPHDASQWPAQEAPLSALIAEAEKEIETWTVEQAMENYGKDDVVFVDEIPKSASGKILRRLLRDRLKAPGG